MQLAVGAPHAAGVAHHHRHGGVHDDVVGHVQVGDALVGVHHGEGRAGRVHGLDVGLDLGALGLGQGLDLGVEVAQAVAEVHAQALDDGGVLGEDILVEHGDRVAEHDGIGDLHHGGLEVQGEQQALLLGGVDLLGVEGAQGLGAHDGAVDDLAVGDGGLGLEDLHGPVSTHELDAHVGGLGHGGGGLTAVEVTGGHVGHAGLGLGRPGTHAVGVLLGEVLHGEGRPAVRVALAQDGVHGAAQALGVAALDGLLSLVLGLLGVVRQVEALALQLLDGGDELGDGGADVGELDDVGCGGQGQGTHGAEVIGDLLGLGELVWEVGEDAARQGDVRGLH